MTRPSVFVLSPVCYSYHLSISLISLHSPWCLFTHGPTQFSLETLNVGLCMEFHKFDFICFRMFCVVKNIIIIIIVIFISIEYITLYPSLYYSPSFSVCLYLPKSIEKGLKRGKSMIVREYSARAIIVNLNGNIQLGPIYLGPELVLCLYTLDAFHFGLLNWRHKHTWDIVFGEKHTHLGMCHQKQNRHKHKQQFELKTCRQTDCDKD